MSENTIMLKGNPPIDDDRKAAAAITPGHLVEITSSNTYQKHSTAGGNAFPIFALEDDLQGNDIDDNYSTNNRVRAAHFAPGDEVLATLKDGQTIVIGDYLESAGDGTLQKHTADTWSSFGSGTIYSNQIVGQALEALDLSDSSGADPASARFRMKVA